ncbi:hypothetical protein GGS23DRAFT_310289 [Durotheca rogersii]|uniref:uncharacterized protein n=1 Tax=Durotheca rogersii TaxID=419775 RepID=UPI0022201293|nr:uncharacterized protein GGS23DRAFT_310289 [Durotheca rogersii]KAI5859678.1 hypothetical protein GGS23DRAFT_310289 [Durotheca rogersii]
MHATGTYIISLIRRHPADLPGRQRRNASLRGLAHLKNAAQHLRCHQGGKREREREQQNSTYCPIPVACLPNPHRTYELPHQPCLALCVGNTTAGQRRHRMLFRGENLPEQGGAQDRLANRRTPEPWPSSGNPTEPEPSPRFAARQAPANPEVRCYRHQSLIGEMRRRKTERVAPVMPAGEHRESAVEKGGLAVGRYTKST